MQIGNHADGKSGGKGQIHLESQPCRTEDIGDGSSEDHSGDDQEPSAGKAFREESRQYNHEDKSDQIAARRSCKFGKSAGESWENRKSGGSEQKIDEKTDDSVFPSKDIDADKQNQIRKGDRNRAYRDWNGERREDTGYGGHQCD